MVTLGEGGEVEKVTPDLFDMFRSHLPRLDLIDGYLNGEHGKPYMPDGADREYRALAAKSITNWMQLVLAAPAQAMYVDGYRTRGRADNANPWRYWQRNGLDARQSAIYRAAMGYGASYTLTRAGVDPLTGERSPVIRGLSPRLAVAAYADRVADDWPELAMVVRSRDDHTFVADVYDDTTVWTVEGTRGDDAAWNVRTVGAEQHGATVVPLVRFADMPDLEGRHPGIIEPLLPIQDRINQTSFDLLMTQTYASFKVRTIAGMVLTPEHDDTDPDASAEALAAARSAKIRLAQDRMLVAEDPDTRMGTLDESPLKPFVEAQDANVRHLAAVSQTPPHHLLGQMANLSAEALAAAEASLTRKVEERQSQFGEAWEQTLRLAAQVDGDVQAATDIDAEVKWRDTEARTFAATIDGLMKAAAGLGVPARGLWERIPGVTDQELSRWEAMAVEESALSDLERLTRPQQLPPGVPDVG